MKHAAAWLATVVAFVWAGAAGAQCEGGRCAGDNNGDGEVTVSELVQAVNVALDGCTEDTCQEPLPPGECTLPASGQTTSYGPGSDGDVQAGASLDYTDNGDGTITDNVTGLTWEKKDDSDGIHDKDNRYTWGMYEPPYTMNGTMVTEFLAALNRPPCFAGHCDWRIPNVKELLSIVDYERLNPAADPAFHKDCTPGCSLDGGHGPVCSCTVFAYYLSSTGNSHNPTGQWSVGFHHGYISSGTKSVRDYVRAVRGGL